jgi:NADPH:quinone reductase-like Zn-dependent oxidoreductase
VKAAVIRAFGPPDALRLEQFEAPRPGQGEVLVKVLAAGVNRIEHYLREGTIAPLGFPHVLGSDAAGVVEAVGPGATRFQPGERVIPMPGYPLDEREADVRPISAAPSYALGGILNWGTYAQYMLVPERWLLRDETGLAPEQVATLPMALVTAVRAVKGVGEVKAGMRVLVHAGASGTGSMNIQVAKALGARIATTVDDEAKAAFARGLGAELVIDVRTSDFVAAARDWTGGKGVDVVVDNLGGAILQRSLHALRPLGIVVSMGFVAGEQATFHVREFFFAHQQIRGTLMGDVEDLEWGLRLVAAGKVKPLLDRTLPLAAAAHAHELIASNRVVGNLVLLPWAA